VRQEVARVDEPVVVAVLFGAEAELDRVLGAVAVQVLGGGGSGEESERDERGGVIAEHGVLRRVLDANCGLRCLARSGPHEEIGDQGA
jgi:hypothetical protein